jgi:O-antigen/teichoic acid export membrane protein
MLVLVRIIAPESYGQFAMVTAVIGFISVFSATNFLAYILQVPTDSEELYQEHFTAAGALQGGAFLVTNIVAFGLGYLETYAAIVPYVHVMSVSFLLEWPTEIRRKMLERAFDWKRLRFLQAIGLIAGAILGVAMAFAGAGTFALLIPGLLMSVPFIWDLFFIQRWRPTWNWSRQTYTPAFRFGLARLGSGLSNAIRHTLQTAAMASLWGFAALGIFGRATGLAQMFCAKFSSQLMYAVYPVLTRLEVEGRDPAYAGGLLLRMVIWTAVPMGVLFAVQADVLVDIVYGSQWTEVAEILPLAAVWAGIGAIALTLYTLLLARNKQGQCLKADFGILIATLGVIVLVLPHGPLPFLWALCGLLFLQTTVLSVWLVGAKGLSWGGFVDALAPSAISAGVGSMAAGAVFGGPELPPLVHLLGWSSVFVLAYLVSLRFLFRRATAQLLDVMPMRDHLRRMLFLPEAIASASPVQA